jgi:surface antigen
MFVQLKDLRMPLIDHRSDTDSVEKEFSSEQSLKIPGLVSELSPVKQLDFSELSPVKQLDFSESSTQSPAEVLPPQLDFPSTSYVENVVQQSSSESATGAVHSAAEPGMSQSLPVVLPPAVTRQLAQTGALQPVGKSDTTTSRQPVVIRGSGKKSVGILPPPRPQRSRVVVHVAVASLMVFVVLGALVVVSPIGHGQNGLSLFNSRSGAERTSGGNSSIISQQQATATAIMIDGHDVGTNTGQFALIPAAPTGANTGSLGRFFYGQCTYWANMRYHALTGNWVTWIGDAWAWRSGAMGAGWNVSSQPHVPSIIVLAPGVQGSGGYGHVAVVESVNSNGSVTTSDWNWYPALGAQTSNVSFSPGAGVSFIWR